MPEGELTRPAVSLSAAEDRAEASATALNLSTGSFGSINMSVDIDGTTYAGEARGSRGPVPLVALLSHTFPRRASF